jgi:hypothetical protein
VKRLHILPDDVRVVRYTELKAIYEREGSLRLTARVIGSDAATVQRHLREAGVDTGSHAITRLKERVRELEDRLATATSNQDTKPQ